MKTKITHEMIEAGANELVASLENTDCIVIGSPADLARSIYEAMARVESQSYREVVIRYYRGVL